MSTTINLPVLLAQLPHLAKVTSVAQSAPKTQAQFAEELSREQEIRQRNQVQEVDEQEKSTAVKDEDSYGEETPRQAADRRRDAQEEESETETESTPRSPWAGNIINIKI